MRKLRFAGCTIATSLLLLALLLAGAGRAQDQTDRDKPVWTLEFIKVKPGMLTPAMGYLDDNWMRVREEAKHEGAVVSYYRIAEESPGESDADIVLMTEFKNRATYANREKLFDRIAKELPRDTSGVLKTYDKKEELFQSVNTRTFSDFSTSGPHFRLLSKL